MTLFTDPALLLLLALLAASLLAYLFGIIAYPYGLLLLIAFIAARLLSIQRSRP